MSAIGGLAEELVAEAFAKAWISWPKISRHPAPQAWVVRTALNTSVSWWRKRRREVALTNHDAASAPDVSTAVDGALMAAVRSLPDRQREVVVLRLFLDLDTASTADVLGVTEGTVMTHLSRALATLRRRYVEADSTGLYEPPPVSMDQRFGGSRNG